MLPSPREQRLPSFHRALHIAREEGARAWELRAATTLARRWGDAGKRKEARGLLTPIHDSFG